MRRPFCVGLTGGLASGKSVVAARLAELGAEVVDTDRIGRELTGPGGAAMPAIVEAFGQDVCAPDGSLDRPAMRRRVFADANERRRLETILHPMILEVVRQRLAHSRAPYIVLVLPLLVEAGAAYRELVDRILVVDCDEQTQIRRAMARDGLDEPQVRAIIAAQAERKARLAVADDVLDNRAGLAELLRQVDALHTRYLIMSAERGDSLP